MRRVGYRYLLMLLISGTILTGCGGGSGVEPVGPPEIVTPETSTEPSSGSPLPPGSYVSITDNPPNVVRIAFPKANKIKFTFNKSLDTRHIDEGDFKLVCLGEQNTAGLLPETLMADSLMPIEIIPSPMGMYLTLVFAENLPANVKFRFEYANIRIYGFEYIYSGHFEFVTPSYERAGTFEPPEYPPDPPGDCPEPDNCKVVVEGSTLYGCLKINTPDFENPNAPTRAMVTENANCEFCQELTCVPNPGQPVIIPFWRNSDVKIRPSTYEVYITDADYTNDYNSPEWHLNVHFDMGKDIFGLEAMVYYLPPGMEPEIEGGDGCWRSAGIHNAFDVGFLYSVEMWCLNSFIVDTYVIPNHEDKHAGLIPWLVWFAGCDEATEYGPEYFGFKSLYEPDMCPAYIDYEGPNGLRTEIKDIIFFNLQPRPDSDYYSDFCADLMYGPLPLLALGTDFGEEGKEGIPNSGTVGDVLLRNDDGNANLMMVALVKGFQPREILVELDSTEDLEFDNPVPPTQLYLYHSQSECEVMAKWHKFFNGHPEISPDCTRNGDYAPNPAIPWDGPFGIYLSTKIEHRSWKIEVVDGKEVLWAWPAASSNPDDRQVWGDPVDMHSPYVSDNAAPFSKPDPYCTDRPVINISHRDDKGLEAGPGYYKYDIAVYLGRDFSKIRYIDKFYRCNNNSITNLSIRGIAQSFGELPSPILTDTEAEYFNPEYSIKVAGIETLFLICPGYEHNPDEKRFNTTCCFVQSHADVIYIDNHGQSNIGQIEPWMDDNVYGGDTCKANSKKFSVLDHIHAFSDFLYNDCNHYINFWQNNLVAMDCNFLFLFSCSQMRGAPEGEQCPRDQWHEIIDNNGLIPSPFIEAVAGYNQILHGYRGTVYHEDYDESTFYEEHCGVYSSVLLDLFADRLLSWDAYNEKEYYDNNIYIYAFMQANLDIANVIGPDGKFRNRNHEQPGQGRAINENHCWYIKADPDSPIKEHPDIDDTGQPILYEVHKSEDWRKPF